MNIEYKKEFFDREYTAKEAYGRAWQYARRYRFRIIVGIICGMLTAGTLLPLFQVIQPTLEKVSANERVAVAALEEQPDGNVSPAADAGQCAAPAPAKHGLAKKMDEASKLPSWYPKAERLARKLGIELQGEDGSMGGALVLMAVVIIPIVALVRLALIFLNQYCLTWSASRVVADLRVDILRQIQRQSMQFHGRIDVGQLMSRATVDPQTVQSII